MKTLSAFLLIWCFGFTLSAAGQTAVTSKRPEKTGSPTDPTAASQWSPPARPRPAAEVRADAKAEAKGLILELRNPKPLTVEAMETFAVARALYREGLFEECQQELTSFWKKNPRDAGTWALRWNDDLGFKLGRPGGYPALILLTDAVKWRLQEKTLAKPVQAVDWNIVVLLVGKSSGLMPANDEEAKAGKGTPVSKTIDPLLLANEHRAVHELVWLTREYYHAVTEGKINLRLRVVHFPEVEFKLCAPGGPGWAHENIAQLKAAIPPDIAKVADWYWQIHPGIPRPRDGGYYLGSFPPGSTPDAAGAGMGMMPGTNKPRVMCDDLMMTRRPNADGGGPLHPMVNQIFLPTWLQHEFFHNHFGQNPHLGLEAKPHQWFDRTIWPKDFVGRFEADYYSEAMFKRLQTQAKPSLAGYFIRRTWFPDLLSALKPEDLVGRYAVAGPKNEWNSGEIKLADGRLEWRNDAGKTWGLTLEEDGVLKTDQRNPYFKDTPHYEILLVRGADGLPSHGISGYRSGAKTFLRQK
ncbi:hypothetical protein LBMAG56_24420 [Verrucomicrobiota bacterium]|nr:hypothetical protein LBMAG56_24420 [Verrucomicrobiota bacterium]